MLIREERFALPDLSDFDHQAKILISPLHAESNSCG